MSADPGMDAGRTPPGFGEVVFLWRNRYSLNHNYFETFNRLDKKRGRKNKRERVRDGQKWFVSEVDSTTLQTGVSAAGATTGCNSWSKPVCKSV